MPLKETDISQEVELQVAFGNIHSAFGTAQNAIDRSTPGAVYVPVGVRAMYEVRYCLRELVRLDQALRLRAAILNRPFNELPMLDEIPDQPMSSRGPTFFVKVTDEPLPSTSKPTVEEIIRGIPPSDSLTPVERRRYTKRQAIKSALVGLVVVLFLGVVGWSGYKMDKRHTGEARIIWQLIFNKSTETQP